MGVLIPTFGKSQNKTIIPTQKHILLAVLDWGLGHASRSVVVARSLLASGVRLSLVGAGASLAFLAKELPECEILELPSSAIRWGGGGWAWQAARQAPKMLQKVRAEHLWLQQYVRDHPVDGILSDCRFGFYHPDIPSVLITHQIHLPLPPPWKVFAQFINRRIMGHFDEIWVPDQAPPSALAGHLSAPQAGLNVHYLGNLSRFQDIDQVQLSHWAKARDTTKHIPKEPYLLVLLSGPEPQRSRLEDRTRQQIAEMQQPVVLVRGLPQGQKEARQEGNMRVYDYAFGQELSMLLASAEWVVCRSGYSTLMDLAALGKKALLIPTPGQLEQEYLARHWQQQNWAFAQKQNRLDLVAGIEMVRATTGPPAVNNQVGAVYSEWLRGL